MSIRSAPLDDIHLEALLVLDMDGHWPARVMRRAVTALYRMHCRLLLALIGLFRRHPQHPLPAIGHERFNLTPAELLREWGRP